MRETFRQMWDRPWLWATVAVFVLALQAGLYFIVLAMHEPPDNPLLKLNRSQIQGADRGW